LELDPRTHAVRADLADIRLAEYVFAPHYAAPLTRAVARTATLHLGRDPQSEILATLTPGDAFEVLEFAGDLAWGVAPNSKLVGYLPADTLAPA
jgi:hypothetical protein